MQIMYKKQKKNVQVVVLVGFLLRLGFRVLYMDCIQMLKFGGLTLLF